MFKNIASIGLVLLVLFPAVAVEQSGNSSNLLFIPGGGVARWMGAEIDYILARTRNEDGKSADPQNVLVCFPPPVDFARGENGRPLVRIKDAETLADGVLLDTMSGEPRRFATAEELAEAVQEGIVNPETEVSATVTLQFHNVPSLRRAVLRHYQQLNEGRDKSQAIALPAQEYTVTCLTRGLEDVVGHRTGNPGRSPTEEFEFKAPAKLVAALLSNSGSQWSITYRFSRFGESHTSVEAESVVKALVNHVAQANGKGGITQATDGQSADVDILCTRDAVDNLQQELIGSRHVIIRGASAEDINLLLGFLQREDADVLAVTTRQVEDAIKRAVDLTKLWNQPGMIKSLEAAENNEELTDEEIDRFWANFRSSANNKSGGGALSIGPVSLGGGGGSSSSQTAANKQHTREATHKFMRDLNTFRTTGNLPVHPNLNYRLLSSARIASEYKQQYDLLRAGKVSGDGVMSWSFSSSTPKLRQDTADAAQDLLERIEAEIERARSLP